MHNAPRPSDLDLFLYVETQSGDKYETLRLYAERNGIQYDSARRMYTRASVSPLARIRLLEYLAQNAHKVTSAYQGIQDIVTRHQQEQREYHSQLSGLQYALFVSDIHFPYHDLDCLKLYYQILHDLQPAYISALNDALDFPSLSHHEDNRKVRDKVLDDPSAALRLYTIHLDEERVIAPKARRVAITGNHDLRIANSPESGDKLTYDTMRTLSSYMWFLDSMAHQNVFYLNKRLAWLHGVSAAKSIKACADSAIHQANLHGNRDQVYDVIQGHTHRMGATRIGSSEFYNSGCLCSMSPFYMNHKPDWQWGITISLFDPHGTFHQTNVIQFKPLDNYLVAFYNGKQYRVKRSGQ